MSRSCPRNCIVPPHILQHMLNSSDREIRAAALNTLLATTGLRAERQLMAKLGFVGTPTGRKDRSIHDCANRSELDRARLVRAEGEDASGDASVDSAYERLGVTYDFFSHVLGRNSIDDRGMSLEGYVHYRRAYNNAFWYGGRMVFGDGDGRVFSDFPGSIDVVAHELTHGVIEHTANLHYHNQSGALNESIADVFGSLVKQWMLGQTAETADWLIGAQIFTPSIHGDALRSLKDPGSAYDDPILGRDPQPDHMSGYVRLPDTEQGDWGGVHINSGIPNKAFYLTATAIGGEAWNVAGHIWYEALLESGPFTDFRQFAALTVQCAGRLYGTNSIAQLAVRDAWSEVGVVIGPPAFTQTMSSRPRDRHAELLQRIETLAAEVQAMSARIAELNARAPG